MGSEKILRELNALRPQIAAAPRPQGFDIYPQAWLADMLARMADHANRNLYKLKPWNWRPLNPALRAAA